MVFGPEYGAFHAHVNLSYRAGHFTCIKQGEEAADCTSAEISLSAASFSSVKLISM